jgi:hypothetical protein
MCEFYVERWDGHNTSFLSLADSEDSHSIIWNEEIDEDCLMPYCCAKLACIIAKGKVGYRVMQVKQYKHL